jgi:hypothetical protein
MAGRQREPSIPLSAEPSAAQRSPTACGWGLTKVRPPPSWLSLPPWLNRVGIPRSAVPPYAVPAASGHPKPNGSVCPPHPHPRSRTQPRLNREVLPLSRCSKRQAAEKRPIEAIVFAEAPKKWRLRYTRRCVTAALRLCPRRRGQVDKGVPTLLPFRPGLGERSSRLHASALGQYKDE